MAEPLTGSQKAGERLRLAQLYRAMNDLLEERFREVNDMGDDWEEYRDG